MDGQNILILLFGVALFVVSILGVTVLNEQLLSEHDPSTPGGLIWHAKNAFSQVRDLETVLEVTENTDEDRVLRMLVRFFNGEEPVLSLRYLEPQSVRDELFVVDGDQLSHYLPNQRLVVIKRWIGLPLSAVGLISFDLTQLEQTWRSGQVNLRVVQDISGFAGDRFAGALSSMETFGAVPTPFPSDWANGFPVVPSLAAGSFCTGGVDSRCCPNWPSLSEVAPGSTGGAIQGGYILEVSDAASGELSRMIWIDPEDYLVDKVVLFSEGRRTTSIRIVWMTVDQGLTSDEVLTFPRDVNLPLDFETIRS